MFLLAVVQPESNNGQHTCDIFLSPNRDIRNFWSGNSSLISGGFHVANFGLFTEVEKS